MTDSSGTQEVESKDLDDNLFSSMTNASINTGTTSMRTADSQKAFTRHENAEPDKGLHWFNKLKPKWSKLMLSDGKIANVSGTNATSSVVLSQTLRRLKRAISTKAFTRRLQLHGHEVPKDDPNSKDELMSITDSLLRGYSTASNRSGGGNPFLKTIYKPMMDDYTQHSGEHSWDDCPIDHFLNIEENDKIAGAILYFLNNDSETAVDIDDDVESDYGSEAGNAFSDRQALDESARTTAKEHVLEKQAIEA